MLVQVLEGLCPKSTLRTVQLDLCSRRGSCPSRGLQFVKLLLPTNSAFLALGVTLRSPYVEASPPNLGYHQIFLKWHRPSSAPIHALSDASNHRQDAAGRAQIPRRPTPITRNSHRQGIPSKRALGGLWSHLPHSPLRPSRQAKGRHVHRQNHPPASLCFFSVR